MRSSTASGSTTSGLWRAEFHAPRLDDGQPCIAVRLVQRDAQAARQARPHIGAQSFQRGRRAVGGDHHPAAQIGKGVDGVEELRRRGGGAADMLKIVDDQHFGGAKLFLEGQRILAIERAQEMAHEILGPQEQRALAALAEFQRGGVQQMGLAIAETAMDVEQRNIALLAFREGARRAMAKSVGGARNEAVEGLLRMQHPRPQPARGSSSSARRSPRLARGEIGDAGRRRPGSSRTCRRRSTWRGVADTTMDSDAGSAPSARKARSMRAT